MVANTVTSQERHKMTSKQNGGRECVAYFKVKL